MPPSFRFVRSVSAASPGGAEAVVPDHYAVSAVLDLVKTAVTNLLPTRIWVRGEVLGFGKRKGHYRFDLVEQGADGRNAILNAAIWDDKWPLLSRKLTDAGIDIRDGQEMLFAGFVRLYEVGGKLTFHVHDVFPEFTFGQVEARRRAVVERLRAEGLCELNKRLSLADVPLRVGLISSCAAKGMDDFVGVLRSSGYPFSVLYYDVPVQGPDMEEAICQAANFFMRQQAKLKLDVLCLVRGGGNVTDLGWWNSYAIGASLARIRIPVICGIGHGQDRVAVDEVAYEGLGTPTAAAHFLVQKVENARATFETVRQSIVDAAQSLVRSQHEAFGSRSSDIVALAAAALRTNKTVFRHIMEDVSCCAVQAVNGQAVRLSRLRDNTVQTVPAALAASGKQLCDVAQQLAQSVVAEVKTEKRELRRLRGAVLAEVRRAAYRERQRRAELSRGAGQAAAQRVLNANRDIRRLTENLVGVFERALAQEQQRLRHSQQLVEACDPGNVLKWGYSLTFNQAGKPIKDATALRVGEVIVTRFAKGQSRSTITETFTQIDGDPSS